MHTSSAENQGSAPQVKKEVIFVERCSLLSHFEKAGSIAASHLYLNDCSGMEIKVIYSMLQFGNRCHIKLKASKSFNFENTHYQRETRNIVFAAGVHPFK